MAISEEEEFEFEMALEAEQASSTPQIPQNAPTAVEPSAVEEYESLSVPKKALRHASNIVGGINKGLVFDLIDTPANLYNLAQLGVHKAGLKDEYNPEGVPSEYVPFLKSMKETVTPRTIPKGVSRIGDALRTGSEWIGGAGLPAAAVAKQGTKAVLAATAPDRMAALGATAGDYSQIPYADTVLGLAGAVKGQPKALKVDKLDKKALDAITSNLRGKPEDVINTIKQNVAKDKTGTLGDLSGGDVGLYSVENNLARDAHSNLSTAIENIQAQHADDIMGDVNQILPSGSYEPLISSAEKQATKRAAGVNKASWNMIDDATARADTAIAANRLASDTSTAAANKLDADMVVDAATAQTKEADLLATNVVPTSVADAPKMSDASKTWVGEQTRLSDELNDVAKTEWAKFDSSPPVDISGEITTLTNDFNKKYLTSNRVDYDKMASKYSSELGRINDWMKTPANPTDIQSVLRDVKEKIHTAVATEGGAKHIDKMMGEMVSGLEKTLIDSPTTSNFATAVAATKSRYDRALPEKMKKLLKSDEVETFADRVNLSGPKGAAAARLAKQSEDAGVINAAQNAMRAKAKVSGIDQKFLAKHDEFLSEFPELKAELTQQITKTDEIAGQISQLKADTVTQKAQKTVALKQATADAKVADRATVDAATALPSEIKGVERKAKLAKAVQAKSTVAQYTKDPDKFLKAHVLSTDKASVGHLKKLAAHAKNNGTSEQLRMQVNKIITENAFKPKAGLAKATGQSIDNFDTVKAGLIESGIMSKLEADNISGSLARIRKLDDRKKAASPVQINQTLNIFEKTMTATTAALGVGAVSPSHALLLNARARAIAEKALLASKNNPEVLKRLEGFILDPQKFLDAAAKAKTAEKATQNVMQKILGNSERMLINATRYRQPYSDEQE